jgi:DNA-binding Lrp family transcriptional regulator
MESDTGNMLLKQAKPMRQYTRAFTLIQVEPMREKEVMEELLKMDEVLEVHMITGEYDVIAVVQVKRLFLEADYDNVFESAIAKIEGVKYVLDTNTVIGMASKTKIEEST